MRWYWLVLATGCYAPKVAPGGPCTSDCPGDQVCVEGTCHEPGYVPADAPEDAPPIDAPVKRVDAPPDAFVDLTLIAHWKFDDPPADGALDSTSRGHDATCVAACPTLVAGMIGNGYLFSAAAGHALRLPDSTDFRGNFTIAAWAKGGTLGADNLSIMAKPQGTGSGNSWQLEFRGGTSKMSFSGGNPHALESPAAVSLGAWHHIAGTWDGTTKKLYVDGVMITSVASAITYDTHMVYLGADENGGALAIPFDGVLDDLRVYNRVLSDGDIAKLATP